MPTRQALALARERELDLVEVAATSDPPVCRILDFGRLRYLSAKKVRESKKTQKNTALREMRIRPRISSHDLASKVGKVKKLLLGGSKVKVSVVFRGREVMHQQIAMSLLKQVAEMLQDGSKLEQVPRLEGRFLSIILAPVSPKGEKKIEGQEEGYAKAEDSQGSKSAISRDRLGADDEAEENDESQSHEKVQKSSAAVRS